MRIISQDGKRDVPYENVIIEIGGANENKIIACSSQYLEGNAYINLAEYSAEEKAIKAMEMCAENYATCEYNKSALTALAAEVSTLPEKFARAFRDGVSEKYVFRFPKDEEVEV